MKQKVVFIEADKGMFIDKFVLELLDIKKNTDLIVVGVFNDVILKVGQSTTATDLIGQYNFQFKTPSSI